MSATPSQTLSRYPVRKLFAQFEQDEAQLLAPLRLTRCPAPSSHGPWLAGGSILRALTGEKQASDVDFFFASSQQYEAFCSAIDPAIVQEVKENIVGKKFIMRDGRSWLLRTVKRPAVQAIKLKWFKSPEEILTDFDLTCCQFAYDGVSIITSELAIYDLKKRQLRINRIRNPAST